MLSKLTFNTRRRILLAGTSLVVAYVRNFIQYHRYSFGSIGEVLSAWFIHWFAVMAVIGPSYVLISTKASGFLEREKADKEVITLEEAEVYGSFVLLALAILTFFAKHWPEDLDLTYLEY